MSINKSQFVTPTQLAKMLGISRIAVHQKIKKGVTEILQTERLIESIYMKTVRVYGEYIFNYILY